MSTRTQVIMFEPRKNERRGKRPRRIPRPVTVEVEPDERLTLSVMEAAQRIGIGRTLMYELIAAGRIETVHIGRAHRVRVEELVAFLDRQTADQRRAEPAS